jgi:hypothetical protein
VKPFLIPPISRLGNTFFASFKARLRRQDMSTTAAKRHAFDQVIDGYTPEEVKEYFEHCQWNLNAAWPLHNTLHPQLSLVARDSNSLRDRLGANQHQRMSHQIRGKGDKDAWVAGREGRIPVSGELLNVY